MSFKKSDLVAIGLALAVIIVLMLLPSPKDNNPPVPPDSKHRALKIEKDCVVCHAPQGERHLSVEVIHSVIAANRKGHQEPMAGRARLPYGTVLAKSRGPKDLP